MSQHVGIRPTWVGAAARLISRALVVIDRLVIGVESFRLSNDVTSIRLVARGTNCFDRSDLLTTKDQIDSGVSTRGAFAANRDPSVRVISVLSPLGTVGHYLCLLGVSTL